MTNLYNASLGQEAEEEPIELTVEQYEEGKAHYKTIIARGEAAKRLTDNPDFDMLIMQGYLVNEPQRLAELMASGRLNDQTFDKCAKGIESVGAFRNFMKMHIEQGRMAQDELESLEAARDESIRIEAAMAAGA